MGRATKLNIAGPPVTTVEEMLIIRDLPEMPSLMIRLPFALLSPVQSAGSATIPGSVSRWPVDAKNVFRPQFRYFHMPTPSAALRKLPPRTADVSTQRESCQERHVGHPRQDA